MLQVPPSQLSVFVSAWAVMMDRRQQNLQLVLLPPALFIPAHQDKARRRETLEALGDAVQPFIIYQETSDIWINVRTCTKFVSGSVSKQAKRISGLLTQIQSFCSVWAVQKQANSYLSKFLCLSVFIVMPFWCSSNFHSRLFLNHIFA